jgi:hypothetical protein
MSEQASAAIAAAVRDMNVEVIVAAGCRAASERCRPLSLLHFSVIQK